MTSPDPKTCARPGCDAKPGHGLFKRLCKDHAAENERFENRIKMIQYTPVVCGKDEKH